MWRAVVYGGLVESLWPLRTVVHSRMMSIAKSPIRPRRGGVDVALSPGRLQVQLPRPGIPPDRPSAFPPGGAAAATGPDAGAASHSQGPAPRKPHASITLPFTRR